MIEIAEQYAHPSYKWIGEKRTVINMQNWQITNVPGGLGFAFYNYSNDKALKVLLKIYRDDGVCEYFLLDTYYCDEYGDNWQKWQTHQLPLFPYESSHGGITHIKFSYLVHKDGKSIPSYHDYKFANKDDLERGWLKNDDFYDPAFKTVNDYRTYELDWYAVQNALNRINGEYDELPVYPIFTRGNVHSSFHPIHEIHKSIDWVIERKLRDIDGWHYIRMAVFDFDNEHVADHLIYAKSNGVDVECIADWAAVSSLNCTQNVAKMRRAGIPIYGIVRNTPCEPSEGISSMHTKIIVFDDEIVHSSSYNFHFHLWGGNWENAIVYHSKDFALLYLNVYHAIRGGVIQTLGINPDWDYNMFYTFGRYYTAWRDYYRPQDAIITEINNAQHTILVVMFDISDFSGASSHDDHETNCITALINAKERGVYIKILLNGMIAHTGTLPPAWDKDAVRPLKEPVKRLLEAGIDIEFVFYWESIYSPLHHKYAVFDSHTLITGSFNWYSASLYSDEVISVIRDERIAGEFLAEADLIRKTFRIGKG